MNSPVEQIKQRLDLIDVIQSYLKLQKAGANYKACCPFHNEKTPSFYVSPSRNIWHCFGCGKGGDLFSFVMEIEKCDFPEALKILAQRAGVELKKEDPRIRSERNRLFNILEDAKNFYKNNLSQNKEVLEYLIKERGLKQETIENFELGYAPGPPFGWRNLYNFLQNKGYSAQEIEKAGLIIKKNNPRSAIRDPQSNYYDRFRNRIMFPINDSSGRTVGFGGRIFANAARANNHLAISNTKIMRPITDSSKPQAATIAKYVNSPQTVVYDKSRALYGFDKAKTEIAKKELCVLVEGYMDAIMSHQAGIKNTVAVSGTTLTPQHLRSIIRLTKNIITAFDTDEAGYAATGRSIDLLLSSGFDVKIVDLKDEKDPADLIKKDAKLWGELLNKSIRIIDFYLNCLDKQCGNDKKKFITETKNVIFPRLRFIESEMEQSFWLRKIAKLADIREEAIWEEFKKEKKNSQTLQEPAHKPSESRDANKNHRSAHLEKRIIGLLFAVRSKDQLKEGLISAVKENLHLFSEKYRPALEYVIQNKKTAVGEKEISGYNALAMEVDLMYDSEELNIDSEARHLINDLKRENIKEKLKLLASEIKKLSETDKSLPKKIKEFNKLSKELEQTTNNKQQTTNGG